MACDTWGIRCTRWSYSIGISPWQNRNIAKQYCTRWKRCKRTSTKSGSPHWKWLRKKGNLSADNESNYLHLTLCIKLFSTGMKLFALSKIQAVLWGPLPETVESVRGGQQVSYQRDPHFEKFHSICFRSDYTQLEDDYKRYISLVEDTYEKMMAAQNSKSSRGWSASDKTPPKSGKSEDSRMSRQTSYIWPHQWPRPIWHKSDRAAQHIETHTHSKI